MLLKSVIATSYNPFKINLFPSLEKDKPLNSCGFNRLNYAELKLSCVLTQFFQSVEKGTHLSAHP